MGGRTGQRPEHGLPSARNSRFGTFVVPAKEGTQGERPPNSGRDWIHAPGTAIRIVRLVVPSCALGGVPGGPPCRAALEGVGGGTLCTAHWAQARRDSRGFEALDSRLNHAGTTTKSWGVGCACPCQPHVAGEGLLWIRFPPGACGIDDHLGAPVQRIQIKKPDRASGSEQAMRGSGSSARIRTWNLAVNSRPLCRLSYRGRWNDYNHRAKGLSSNAAHNCDKQ